MGFQCIVLFLFLLSSPALAKFSPRFPSSIVRPEQLAQITNINDEAKPYETRYFTQILDHFNFNPQSYQTFQQRYLINEKYWGGAKKKAPIFVYMGNEGDIEWFAHNTGFMYENAPHFNALLVFIEHRYYGKSIPYGGDKEVAYKNATTQGYLSSTQALADYATLILDLKNNLTASESPVVVFGGSYGGMLAAWFRLKYPHVAIGALASSSPILNFGNLTSPFSFNNIVTQDFRSESENCYEVIKESWTQIEETAKQNGGLEKLRSSFNICKNITISADEIESWLSTAYIYTAMTDYPTPSNFLNPLPEFPVKQICKAIDNPLLGNDTFAKLYGAANIYYNYSGNLNCFDIAGDNDKHGLQEWTWQACTEMILPTDGNNKESIFPASNYSYNDRESYCTSLYGVQPRPHWITTEFGGTDIHRVLRRYGSNILFFNGIRDPWSGGGVLKSISNSLVAIIAKEVEYDILSNPSEVAAPKLMKKLADMYFTKITASAESAYSLTPRQSALWKSQQGDHTSAWLRAVFISGLGQTMNAKTYRCVLSYRLGVPLFSVSTSCSACSRVFAGDIFGDHAVSCAGIVGIKHRHNVVRDTLVDVCYRSGISARKEVDIGLAGGNDEALRPTDVLLYSWDRGRDVCVDLTGSSPLTQSGLSHFIPGRVVADAAHRKRAKYEARCQTIGYGFIPFSFSSLGELEKEVVALLKRIQRFSTTQDIGARAAAHIFTRIGFAIARGVGAQIVSRLPTNLL